LGVSSQQNVFLPGKNPFLLMGREEIPFFWKKNPTPIRDAESFKICVLFFFYNTDIS